MLFEDMRVGQRVKYVNPSGVSEEYYGKDGTVVGLNPHRGWVYIRWDDEEFNLRYRPTSSIFNAYSFTLVEDVMTNQAISNTALRDAWNLLTDASGIGPGDVVRITRGWDSSKPQHTYAVGGVRDLIGEECEVYATERYKGFKFIKLKHSGYMVPYDVLELVKKAKPAWAPRNVALNVSYDATVHEDKVVVGCQTFSFDAVEDLYAAVQEAKKHAKDD